MEASQGFTEAEVLSPEQAARYLRYVKEAKEATKNGDLEEAFKLFNLAKDIFPNEKVMSRIQKIQEALEELADQGDDEFTDVCQSGLLLYRELHDQLFEHQKEGIAFLYSLYRDGRKGGILADDMGLGKTIQIIAFLSGMFDASLVSHVLLIMPTSLINTWLKEFAKWTPGMRVKTFHGPSKQERSRNLSRIQQRNGVIITTYQMLLNNWQQLSSLNGQEFVWDYVILDEAHKIKTSSTKSAICARTIPARNRILLTGTPVQNNLQELWSLFDFACQGSLLGTLKTFKMEYENPITRAREKDATPGEKALGFKISENLMAIIKPYFLRRTKEEVQKKRSSNPEVGLSEKNPDVDATHEMPSLSRKNDLIIWIRLVPLQEEIYRKFVSLDHIKELLMETRSPLAELSVLKKLCDHPRLLSARACHLLNLGTVRFSAQHENEEESSDMDHINEITDDTLMNESGKMIFLMDLLKKLRDDGHQTLVFSQSTQILNIIERLLKNRHFKILRIDGTITHLVEREKRINLFQQNKDYSVFLLTTQVGGVGLTLTAATRVVIFDPSWNPATDAQAVDRAHRIGQRENVVVYRLITCGTVEEKIYRRQVFKDSLIRQTTGDRKNPFRYFSKQELRELFTIEDFQNSVTQLQLQFLHAAQRRSDEKLDEHIAYLHSLGIAGISDHDLMYTHDLSVKEELDVIEESHYIQQRVEKAQFLVERESQNTELLMARQRTGHEGAWPREPVFPSQTKKKCPESNKPRPQPSPLITTHQTQEEEISSQMASVIIDDLPEDSEEQDLSGLKVNVTVPQDGRHPHESTLDDDVLAALPTGCGSREEIWTDSLSGVALQKEASQEGPTQEALQENPLGNSSYLLSKSVRVDLGPYLDELKDDVILHHGSPCPMNPITNENQNTESYVSVIQIADDDLSASHSALQDAQAYEATLEEEPPVSSAQYMCDFNLFLEDSAGSRQNLSSPSLELVEKERSSCGSATNSRAEFEHSKACVSMGLPEKDDELEEVVNMRVRRKARRIVSDSEGEDDTFQETSSTDPFNTSPFQVLPVKEFDASTPKNDRPPGRFFSPKILDSVNMSINCRRSLASRRSLINVVLDHVEDMEEGLDSSSEAEDWQEDRTEGSSDEAPACTEEEPSREALPSESKSSCFAAPKPGAPAQEASPGDPEPVSGGHLADGQDKATEAADDYETLVMRGKALKECGKTQEALACLVKALDIKSADPEVMLMTLSLYKQLNTT
ncbi:DNA excision repair protein ERCC-6-like [Hipposideros larvatus]